MDDITQAFLETLTAAKDGDPASLQWMNSIEAAQVAARLQVPWHSGGSWSIVNFIDKGGMKEIVEKLAEREKADKR